MLQSKMKITLQQFLENAFVVSCNADLQKQFYSNFSWSEVKPKLFDGRQQANDGIRDGCKCALSHFQLVKMAKCLGLPYITIFEDDAVPMVGVAQKLDQFFCTAEIPDDADMLLLGNLTYIYEYSKCCCHLEPTSCKSIAKVQNCGIAGSHAYMIFQKAYDRYIDIKVNGKHFVNADGMFATKHTKDLACYASVPSFFIQSKAGVVQHSNLLLDKWNLPLFDGTKPIAQLITFATQNAGIKMHNAHSRWTAQIQFLKDNRLAEDGKVLTEDDLDAEWKDRFGKYTTDCGYAYWSWKPYVIDKMFSKMEYGSSLCYFDGGCVLPECGQKLLDLAYQMQQKLKLLEAGTYDIALTRKSQYNCSMIARKETLDKMGLAEDDAFLCKFLHWQGGLILVVKTPKTEKLVKDWKKFFFDNYETCIHFPFLDKTDQRKEFVHNGADQAILQCLLYKMKLHVLDVSQLLLQYARRQRN